MRPKKVIVIVDPDTERRQRMALVLDTRGYSVIDAQPAELLNGPLAIGRTVLESADLVLVTANHYANNLSVRILEMAPEAAQIIVSQEPSQAGSPGMWFTPDLPLPSLLDRIRTSIMRKRGPKKKTSFNDLLAEALKKNAASVPAVDEARVGAAG